MLSGRYAKILEKTQNRSLNKDHCGLLLRDSIGEGHDSNLPNIRDHNPGTGLQEEPWDDFEDNNIKKSLEEVLHHKRMAKFDASYRVGSTSEDWSDLNTSECVSTQSLDLKLHKFLHFLLKMSYWKCIEVLGLAL